MAVIVKINNVDKSDQFKWAELEIEQILSSQTDNARFKYTKYGSKSYLPAVGDDVGIFIDTTKIFGGTIQRISEVNATNPDGLEYSIEVLNYSFLIDGQLVSKTYTNQTVAQIIADIVTSFAPAGFTTSHVSGNFNVPKIVFNQVTISSAITTLARLMQYDWYIDETKDVHFFSKYTNFAPFNLTDTSGNYVNATLERQIDGSQIANQVKVRGGQYLGSSITDKITVKGANSASFILPYQLSGLTIKLNTVSKTVGIDNIDTFPSKDVLYNFDQKSIRFASNLADGDVIEYSGQPYVPVLAIASDSASIAQYGLREKLIKDDSIKALTVARQRAAAEIKAYKDSMTTAKFTTYTSGLRTGMVINLNSTKRSANTDMLVKRVRFSALTPTSFVYEVETVTTREHGLIELLQEILSPESRLTEEAEVSESIKIDIQAVSIVESIQRIIPHAVVETVSISENIQKDPLGAGVAPDFVVAPYSPTGITDTKRVGFLDNSLQVY